MYLALRNRLSCLSDITVLSILCCLRPASATTCMLRSWMWPYSGAEHFCSVSCTGPECNSSVNCSSEENCCCFFHQFLKSLYRGRKRISSTFLVSQMLDMQGTSKTGDHYWFDTDLAKMRHSHLGLKLFFARAPFWLSLDLWLVALDLIFWSIPPSTTPPGYKVSHYTTFPWILIGKVLGWERL